jgi:hypothetical protein
MKLGGIFSFIRHEVDTDPERKSRDLIMVNLRIAHLFLALYGVFGLFALIAFVTGLANTSTP